MNVHIDFFNLKVSFFAITTFGQNLHNSSLGYVVVTGSYAVVTGLKTNNMTISLVGTLSYH